MEDSGTADADATRRMNTKLNLDALLSDLSSDIEGSSINVTAPLDLKPLLAGLFDTWSEVRADSAKSLAKHQASLPARVVENIVDMLNPVVQEAAAGKTVSWQKLHGALRGIRALMPLPTSYTERLRAAYIAVQGHALLPVREEGRRGLLAVCALGSRDDKLSLLNMILSYLEQNLHSKQMLQTNSQAYLQSEETLAYLLDGLYQVMIGILEQFATLELLAAEQAGQRSVMQHVLELLLLGMADASSTVRQSAGGGLTTLLLRCVQPQQEAGGPRLAVDVATAKFHQQALTAVADTLGNEKPDWTRLEACVLVAEEVLSAHLNMLLQAMRLEGMGSSALRGAMLLPKSFCCAAQTAIPLCLLHSKFEIRRVGSQLLPTLARYLTLFERELLFQENSPWVQAVDKTRWPAAWRESFPTAAAHEEQIRQLLVALAWAAETAKAQQHVAEALLQTNNFAGNGVGTGLNESADESPAISGGVFLAPKREKEEFLDQQPLYWALEVRGRLMQDQAKHRFHSELHLVLTGKYAKECAKQLNSTLLLVRLDIVRLVSCLADTWRSVADRPTDSTGSTAEQVSSVFRVPEQAPGKSDPLRPPLLIAADLVEATGLACALLLDMGPAAQSLCPDVSLSLTSDGTWVTQCFNLALMLGAASHLRPLAALSGVDSAQACLLQGRAVVTLPSVTDPAIDVRLPANADVQDNRTRKATNRWVCEAIAPVLPLLTTARARRVGSGGDYRLGIVVSQWVLACVGDALWLDHRPHARRALFGALAPTIFASLPISRDAAADSDVPVQALQVFASLLVSATILSGNTCRDLGQQRGHAVEASEIGTLARCCLSVLQSTCADLLPKAVFAKLQTGAMAARERLRVSSSSRPASSRTTPLKSAFPLRQTASQARELQSVACKLLGDDEDEDEEAAAGEAPVVVKEQPDRETFDDHVDPLDDDSVAQDGGTFLGGDNGEEEEFSDWDEDSEDELNASSNSVQPLGTADGEVAQALVEIDALLGLLDVM